LTTPKVASRTRAGWDVEGEERTHMSQTPPPPAAAAAGTGQVGKVRNPLGVILLMFITLGIYAFVWWYKSFKELKDYSSEGVGGVAGLILAFCYVSYFLLPSEVGNLYSRESKPKPVSGVTGFWVLLPLLGLFIYIFKVQGATNDFWKSKGAS
jgi:hypothetical protein